MENKKLLFKEIGLIISLAIVLGAFEWSTSEKATSTLAADNKVVIEEEQVPITQDTPPPPPAELKEPVVSDIIDIVDDDVKVDDKLLISSEDDKSLGVEIKNYVVQNTTEEAAVEEEVPFAIVEEKPTFRGGDQNDFTKWVFAQVVYPEIAKENGVQGRVTLQFTVNTDGRVSDVKVLRGVDSSLDKEAVRVVSSSPKWAPGKQRGKAVKVRFTFPVIFQLK
ncbi:MAG: energy transducer TonB [Bacteroidales bacterium]